MTFSSSPSSAIAWLVGTCGISDPDWVGNFYPPGLPSSEWLKHYARKFNSIEINATFHAIPKREVVRRWKEVTPPDFRFCVKFPKEVTHDGHRRLLSASALDTA